LETFFDRSEDLAPGLSLSQTGLFRSDEGAVVAP